MALRLGSRRDVTRDIDVAYDEHAVTATGAEREATGVKAVMVSLRRALSMGPFRTAASLVRLNQRKGFDCPGCAWPEEQGAIADLEARPEYWLSQQGRLTHPMMLRQGDDHYRPRLGRRLPPERQRIARA